MTPVSSLAAVSVTGSQILHLLGRLHPAVVHFPIALVSLAALLETWQLVRRKPGLHPATPSCLVFGALSCLAAAVLGWFLEDAEPHAGLTMELHRWIGFASVAGAIVGMILLVRASSSPSARLALRAFLFLGATLVGVTGYLGGELAFGKNHLVHGIFDEPHTDAIASADAHADEDPGAFKSEVAPILRTHCLRCHGGGKTKGKLSVKTRADALAEAKHGVAIVPGKPMDSSFFTRLIDKDDPMPPADEKPLTPAEIERLKKWIADGAPWPEGVVLN